MKALLFLLTTVALLLPATAGSQKPEPAGIEFTTTATIKDIMVSMIDPSADYLWESVATVISQNGLQSREPRTDQEWSAVRNRAIILLEATNLLLIPGRHVAKPGDKSENPGIELSPEEIEGLLTQDRESWNKLTRGLYDATMVTLKAVEAKDAKGLAKSGDRLDQACENCHLKYWYPAQARGR